MNSVIHLSLILLIVSDISNADSNCTISLEDADKCGLKTSFFGNRDVIIPTTEADIDVYCSASQGGVKCVQDFVSSCLTGFVRQTSELALSNGAKHLDKRCKDAKDRKDFITYVKCYVDKSKMEPLHVCADKNLAMLELFLDMKMEEEMGVGCCIFQLFQRCIHNTNLQQCGEEVTEYWDEVIIEMTQDSMAFSCAGFETVDKCQKAMEPKLWSELLAIDTESDPKVIAAKQKHKSAIALMIDFLKKLANK